MKFYRPTYAEIDLGAIRYNLQKIRGIIGKHTAILGVVKADAYGHGMIEVTRVLAEEGVQYLGVSSLDEAKALRRAGIKNSIIVLGTILPEEVQGVLAFDVVQTISDLDIARLLSKLGKSQNKEVKVHIKIDTGMGRIGFWHKEAVGFVKEISSLKNIAIDGIFTHFPSAEDDKVFTKKQMRDFTNLLDAITESNIDVRFKHTSNSAALIDFKDSHMNMVRPGLILYGLHPREDLIKKLSFRPALSLKTKVVYVKPVSKGRSISYGRTYVAKRDTRIATIPVGYGDGYSRHLSNKGEVLIKGKRAPIVGRVCMDMCMVDVGHIDEVRPGDEVILIGEQRKEKITVEELAKISNTIPYEVVCNIGRRVPRVYTDKIQNPNFKIQNKSKIQISK